MIGEGYARAMTAFLLAVALSMFALGALAVWGLPKLWGWVKPVIHAITA